MEENNIPEEMTAANHETALEQAARNEAHDNEQRKIRYENALRDWVAEKPRLEGVGATVPPQPVCEPKVRYDIDPETNVTTVVELNEPASTKTAADFAVTPPTMVGAVGGPVGARIEGESPNRFYVAAGDHSVVGSRWTAAQGFIDASTLPDGQLYVKESHGFGVIFWRKA